MASAGRLCCKHGFNGHHGEKAGLSVCELWGGKLREQIPVYASFQSYSDRPDWSRHSLRLIEKAVRAGFKAVKLKAGGKMFSEDLAHIQAFQEMTGQSTGLILDANQSYDQAAARKWETWFSGWQNVLWFEEPMPFDDLAEYRMLRSALSVPVAGGENVKAQSRFADFSGERSRYCPARCYAL